MTKFISAFLVFLAAANIACYGLVLVPYQGKDSCPKDKITSSNTTVLKKGKSLLLTMGNPDSGAWITFSGDWDLSGFARAGMEFTNHGPGVIRLELLFSDNNSFDKWENTLHRGIRLNKGESISITLPLSPRLNPGEKLPVSGIKHLAEGLPSPSGINLKRINGIRLCKSRNGFTDTIEIKRIFAEGIYHPMDTKHILPLVDRYGQLRHGEWAGKIHNDQELNAAVAKEKKELASLSEIPDRNQYGGWLSGPQLKSTGKFHTEKYKGKWYIVDPDGKLFFSLGINHVDILGSDVYTALTKERQLLFEKLPDQEKTDKHFYWTKNGKNSVSFLAWNLSRKYGSEWQKISQETAIKRLKSWGINTLGHWSNKEIIRKERIPYTVGFTMAGRGVKSLGGNQTRRGTCYDVYDPSFGSTVKTLLAEIQDLLKSPWCLGIFIDNELHWNDDFAVLALRAPESSAAKQAFINDLKQKYKSIGALNSAWKSHYKDWGDMQKNRKLPDRKASFRDFKDFYRKTVDTYYSIIKKNIQAMAPGCLYLGSRYAEFNPEVFEAAAKYCDIVSFNLYVGSLKDFTPPARIDVPLLVGEFHFGATDRGMWGSGLTPARNQHERAEKFRKYVISALEHPQFVGCHWFEYYDQPFSGRMLDGENYNIGFVNNVDIPYPEMVNTARQVSKDIYKIRSFRQPK